MSERLVRFMRKHPDGVVLTCYLWILLVGVLSSKPWDWTLLLWLILGPLYLMITWMFVLLWRLQRAIGGSQQRASQEHE